MSPIYTEYENCQIQFNEVEFKKIEKVKYKISL